MSYANQDDSYKPQPISVKKSWALIVFSISGLVVFTHYNLKGPPKDFKIYAEPYKVPVGCIIDGISDPESLDKYIYSARKFNRIAYECLPDKYKVPDDIKYNNNFTSQRYTGRNYYRFGRDAVNLRCRSNYCLEKNRHRNIYVVGKVK